MFQYSLRRLALSLALMALAMGLPLLILGDRQPYQLKWWPALAFITSIPACGALSGLAIGMLFRSKRICFAVVVLGVVVSLPIAVAHFLGLHTG